MADQSDEPVKQASNPQKTQCTYCGSQPTPKNLFPTTANGFICVDCLRKAKFSEDDIETMRESK